MKKDARRATRPDSGFVSGLLLGAATVAGLWLARRPAAKPPLPDADARPHLNATRTPSASPTPPPTFPPKPSPYPDFKPDPSAFPPGPERKAPPRVMPPLPEEPVMAFKPLEPAGPSRRQLILVGSGLLLAAVATVGAWLALNAPSSRPSAPGARTLAMQPQASSCQMAPAAAIAGEADGRFPLMADLSGLISADIASLVVLGQEVAAARPRDAEVAFLMSCRLADRLKGVDSVESADARQQLALHYARLGGAGSQADLMKRAEQLHTESVQTYQARLGKTHEKSRLAAEGLAATRQTLAQASAPQAKPLVPLPAPEPVARQTVQEASLATPPSVRPAPQARVRPEAAVAAKSAPKAPPRARTHTAVGPSPSFNCAKARSTSEKMICADPQLAQMDSDLGRLHARARNAAPDRAAFRRQSDQEWLRREANCRDRQCLLRWYAQRREQLVSQIEGPHQAPAFRYGAD